MDIDVFSFHFFNMTSTSNLVMNTTGSSVALSSRLPVANNFSLLVTSVIPYTESSIIDSTVRVRPFNLIYLSARQELKIYCCISCMETRVGKSYFELILVIRFGTRCTFSMVGSPSFSIFYTIFTSFESGYD